MINEIAQKQIDYIDERCKEIQPLVAIRCITYNHEKYIKEALEGFVIQKTDFPFVAIVHDDASTDNTAAIIREYAEKYPDIIFPIFEKENLYSKWDGSLKEIMNEACEATEAKYYAMCEGDDYWIDPLKLQKQVDFMEANPDYSLCFTKAQVISDDPKVNLTIYDHLKEKEYSADDIIRKWTIPTASTLIKANVFKAVPSHKDFCVGDNVLFLTSATKGKLYCLDDKTCVYRRQSDGWVLKTGKIEILKKHLKHNKALSDTFTTLKLPSLINLLGREHASFTFYKIKTKHLPINEIKEGYKIAGIKYLKHLFLIPLKKISKLRS